MAAPRTGPNQRKLRNEHLAEVFEGDYRKEAGKLELNANEIKEILNGGILPDGTTVTRQAVDKRLDALVGTEFEGLSGRLERTKHGRSHLYYRTADLEKVFSDGFGRLLFENDPRRQRALTVGGAAVCLLVGLVALPYSAIVGSFWAAFSLFVLLWQALQDRRGSNLAYKLEEAAVQKIRKLRG